MIDLSVAERSILLFLSIIFSRLIITLFYNVLLYIQIASKGGCSYDYDDKWECGCAHYIQTTPNHPHSHTHPYSKRIFYNTKICGLNEVLKSNM